MSKKTLNITVPVLARVEGEGALDLKIHDQHIDELRLRIYEPPRYFEKFLEGRSYAEVPDAVARICGICPVAYQMTAVHAIESIFHTGISPWTRAMRRVMYCGEWLQSHSLHIHMLAAPDFLGFNSIIEMAEQYPAEVRRGLMLQTLGNDLITLFGGRSVHPVGVRTGGFHKAPSHERIENILIRLRAALTEAEALANWAASLDLPDDEQDFVCVALRHETEYPFNEGRIVSDHGLDIGIDDYETHFREIQVPHSTALHSLLHDKPYLLGPLARINLNRDRLPETVRAVMDATGIHFPSRNMFHSIVARAVEIHYAIVEAIQLLENVTEVQTGKEDIIPAAGTGFGCTEAPRGLLWHRYQLDSEGRVEQARIVPPTSQNQARIEEDLQRSLERFGLQRDENELRLHAEKVIRNYDPCISCATHFLQLKVERSSPVGETLVTTEQSVPPGTVGTTPVTTQAATVPPTSNTSGSAGIHIVGIGSPYGADQLGWEVVQQLEQDADLQAFIPEILTLHTLDRPGTSLLEILDNSKHIIVIDALSSGKANRLQHEHIIKLSAEELIQSDAPLSTHAIGLREALTLHRTMENTAQGKNATRVIIFGLDAGDNIDIPFSPSAIRALTHAVKKEVLTNKAVRRHDIS